MATSTTAVNDIAMNIRNRVGGLRDELLSLLVVSPRHAKEVRNGTTNDMICERISCSIRWCGISHNMCHALLVTRVGWRLGLEYLSIFVV